jgi:hypothetical protein
MIKEALQYLVGLGKPEVIQNPDALAFTDRPLHAIGEKCRPEHIPIHTLTGLVDFAKDLPLRLVPDLPIAQQVVMASPVLLVESPTVVKLMCRRPDAYGKHVIYAQATHEENLPTTSQLLPAEQFIIALHLAFQPREDFSYVLQVASNLTTERVVTSKDDGLTQTAGTRKGVILQEKEKVKPRVKLARFRTFREIEEQPVSEFLFRLNNVGDDEPPRCMLLETDGGAWKLAAMKAVAEYLKSQSPEIPVIY